MLVYCFALEATKNYLFLIKLHLLTNNQVYYPNAFTIFLNLVNIRRIPHLAINNMPFWVNVIPYNMEIFYSAEILGNPMLSSASKPEGVLL